MADTLAQMLEHRCHIAHQTLQNVKQRVRTNDPPLMIASHQAAVPTAPIGDLVDCMSLPMDASDMNKELIRLHLQILSRFKVAVDGSPSPKSRYLKYWLPFNLHNPLLLQILLFTSASFLNERDSAPETVVLKLKADVYQRLNYHIEAPGLQTDDVAIMAVSQLVMDSWYWGANEDLCTHIEGLKQMIGLRGGLKSLGLQGFLAKTILIHDISMALAHQTEPQMYGHPGFEFEDPVLVARNEAFDSPLALDPAHIFRPAGPTCPKRSTACTLYNMRVTIRNILRNQYSRDPISGGRYDLGSSNGKAELPVMPSALVLASGGLPATDGRQHTQSTPWSCEPMNYGSETTGNAHSMPTDTPKDHQIRPAESISNYRDTVEDDMESCISEISAVYHQAIAARQPTSETLSSEKAIELWHLVWRIPLDRWKKAIGIFIWAMVAIVPSIHNTRYARFVKTMLVVGMMTVSMENWHAAIEVATTALKLQQWLKGLPNT